MANCVTQSVKWQRRLQDFSGVLLQLKAAVLLSGQRPLSGIEKLGVVRVFELAHGLACKVMNDFSIYQGNTQIMGSRDATRHAFEHDIVMDGEHWMEMISDRELATHAYEQANATKVIEKAITVYYPLFVAFEDRMQGLIDNQ